MRFRPLGRLSPRSPRRIRDDIDDEIAFYLQERADELTADGTARADALDQARREFGDIELTKRYCADQDLRAERESAFTMRLSELAQDLAFALRTLRRAPLIGALAVITLALGIGATTSMFTVVRAILLEGLPYRRPTELVRLYTRYVDGRQTSGQISAGDFLDYTQRQRTLTGLAAFAYGQYVLATPEGAEAMEGARVTHDFFRVLGAFPALGRTFEPADSAGAATDLVVLAHGTWRRTFASDPRIVGRVVRINGEPCTIIGVMGEHFVGPMGPRGLFTLLDLRPQLDDAARVRKFRFLSAVGRLAPDRTIDDARADLERIADAMAAERPATNARFRSRLIPLKEAMVGPAREAVLMLMGAAALLLLLACANVAGLALARSVARARELAVRNALGAGRARLVRQMLAESLLLSIIGGAAGVALAWWGTKALGSAAARTLPPLGTIDVDPVVLLFALVTSVACGVIFGTAPALAATRLDVAKALRTGGRGHTSDRRTLAPRSVLAGAQIALAVMLLIGAGLLARTLYELQRLDRGYDPSGLLTFSVPLGGARYDSRATEGAYYDALFARLRSLPGVVAAGATGTLPLGGSSSASFAIRGRLEAEGQLPEVGYVTASDEYFEAMRIPLRAGRRFDSRDRTDATPAVIISESVARRFFPDGDALGAQVRLGPDPSEPWSTVVGIVADVRRGLADDARPTAYVNVRQDAWGGAEIVIRTARDPAALIPAVRRELRALDPGVPMVDVQPLTESVRDRLASKRLWAQLMLLFAAVALTLSAIGVYGVIAYGVTARAKELGVRVALGATPREVLSLVLSRGARLAAVGLVLGMLGAAASGRLLATQLYGVRALDGWTYGAAAALIGLIALAASYVPARRAMRVDPVTVLRAE